MTEPSAGRSSGQDDTRTPSFYRQQAAHLRLQAMLYEASAQSADRGFPEIGSIGEDLGQRLALRLRECARELSWTATQLDVYAVEATACEADSEDVGRTDQKRNSAPVIVLGTVAGGAA